MAHNHTLNLPLSVLGQSWCWRGLAADAESFGAQGDLTNQLLRARGCSEDQLEAYRSPTIRAFMPDPAIFNDMEKAATRIADAVEQQQNVTVFGDYDVDGATSSALLIRLLRSLGLEAQSYIPDRLLEGYGPSGKALVQLKQAGADLVITVDCGAQAFEAIDAANAAGLEVIIVDHHQCTPALPAAFALVNPNRLDESPEAAAFGNLAAVGVAFLLGAALLRNLRQRGYFTNRTEPKLLELLDIVALGTVADMAALTGLNRAFVAQGLKIMAQGQNSGLQALGQVAQVKQQVQCADLGFAFGPRINAGGRIGKSDLGVRLLTSESVQETQQLAAEMNTLNQERREIEALVCEEALEAAKSQHDRALICVSSPHWHPGVIGIVAGRLKEQYNRPVFVVAVQADGVGKGSGRSISGVDLGGAVISAKAQGVLLQGGGHKMAAGVTVPAGGVAAFHDYMEARLHEDIAHARTQAALLIDALLAPRGINTAVITEMEQAGPYGIGWPAPRAVAGPYKLVSVKLVGTKHVSLIVRGEDGASLKAVAFRAAETALGTALFALTKTQSFYLAGRAKIDTWNGRNAPELHVEDMCLV